MRPEPTTNREMEPPRQVDSVARSGAESAGMERPDSPEWRWLRKSVNGYGRDALRERGHPARFRFTSIPPTARHEPIEAGRCIRRRSGSQ